MASGQVGNPIYLSVSYGPGKTGLGTVGYTLKNPDGSVYRARTDVGVIGISNGDYQALVGFNDEWQGFIEWDTGEDTARIARETIEILPGFKIAPPTVTPYQYLANRSRAFNDFISLLNRSGSYVLFHRDDSVVPCPCLTMQGFRDPIWHIENADEPVCNNAGMLPSTGTTTEFTVRAFVQPVQSGAVRRLTTEQLGIMFGEVQSDDHLGIFPVVWNNVALDFFDWGMSVEDYIVYNERNYTVVSCNLIPDPSDGNPWHHYEVGLRLVNA
jgi:hypothetical protein